MTCSVANAKRCGTGVDILNPEAKVIEALTNIDLPSGVSIDVKMM